MLPSGGRRSAYGAGSGGVGGGSGDMVKSCLARTPDVRPGATEVYGKLHVTANCIIIDHFSTLNRDWSPRFSTLRDKNGWVRAKTA